MLEAQQNVALSDESELGLDDAAALKKKLTGAKSSTGDSYLPNYGLVFAIQCPSMLFVLSVATFLAGLWSVVFSPLALKRAWGDDAKVRLGSVASNKSVLLRVRSDLADFCCKKDCDIFWSVECSRHGFVPDLLRSDTSNGRFRQVDPSQISRCGDCGGSCVAQVRIFMD